MLDADTVHWHCPSLSRVQPFGLPRNDGTYLPPPYALSARHTRSGVAGISILAPASATAFITAAREAVVPASPTPLTPSGLVVQRTGCSRLTISGRSSARGIV